MAKNTTYIKIPKYKGLSIGFYDGKDKKYWIARVFYRDRYHEKIIQEATPTSKRNQETILAAKDYDAESLIDILAIEFWREVRGEQPTFSDQLCEAYRKSGLSGFLSVNKQQGLQVEIINEDPEVCVKEIQQIDDSYELKYQELCEYSYNFVRNTLYPPVSNQYSSVKEFIAEEISPFTPQNILSYTKKIKACFPRARLLYKPPHINIKKGRKKGTIEFEHIWELTVHAINAHKEDAKECSADLMTHSFNPFKGFDNNEDRMQRKNNTEARPFYQQLPSYIKGRPKHGVVRKFLKLMSQKIGS